MGKGEETYLALQIILSKKIYYSHTKMRYKLVLLPQGVTSPWSSWNSQ